MRLAHILVAVLLAAGSPLVTSVSAQQATEQPFLPDFFQKLIDDRLTDYSVLWRGTFEDFCAEMQVEPSSAQNRDAFMKLSFLHDLFTSSGAVDGLRAGYLQIPYFWHWVTPNPRHQIRSRTTGGLIVDEPPPARFSRYESLADVDRLPSLLLADLVTPEPQYEHPRCGSMYTFGWCSEREMTFCLLAALLGLEGKIVQSNNHVWSEFCLRMQTVGSESRRIRVRVDNTFDLFTWDVFPAHLEPEEWLQRHSNVGLERWYNRQARRTEEVTRVRQIRVPAAAQRRIENLVDAAMEHDRVHPHERGR